MSTLNVHVHPHSAAGAGARTYEGTWLRQKLYTVKNKEYIFVLSTSVHAVLLPAYKLIDHSTGIHEEEEEALARKYAEIH